MLTVELGEIEYFDSSKNEFVYEKGKTITFEYSLKAVYEWEGRWRKPFLKGELTYNEMIDFYKSMALEDFDEKFLSDENFDVITSYIQNSNTATTFTNANINKVGVINDKKHTSEEIYAMMFSAGIPLEFENRNLNRLLTILKVISIQNNPPKKMNKDEILRQNSNINKQRKAMMNSKG